MEFNEGNVFMEVVTENGDMLVGSNEVTTLKNPILSFYF